MLNTASYISEEHHCFRSVSSHQSIPNRPIDIEENHNANCLAIKTAILGKERKRLPMASGSEELGATASPSQSPKPKEPSQSSLWITQPPQLPRSVLSDIFVYQFIYSLYISLLPSLSPQALLNAFMIHAYIHLPFNSNVVFLFSFFIAFEPPKSLSEAGYIQKEFTMIFPGDVYRKGRWKEVVYFISRWDLGEWRLVIGFRNHISALLLFLPALNVVRILLMLGRKVWWCPKKSLKSARI